MDLMENESIEDYIQVVKEDYELSKRCIGGWIDIDPITVAYPYSKRHEIGDKAILENTGYRILMGGREDRGTIGNYFVDGCDIDNQIMIMSRSCRMDGTPVSEYVLDIVEEENSMFSE